MPHPSVLPAIGRRSTVSVQKQTYEPFGDGLLEDFPARFRLFMQVSGLGPRPLGRLLGVSPYRVREWRRGVVPSWHYLSRLLTVAESIGLGETLMCPGRDGRSRPEGLQTVVRYEELATPGCAEGAAPTAHTPL